MKARKRSEPKQKFVEKCFTVRQPWAYLIMAGTKKVEYRGVKTKYRGRVAVHASATMDAHNRAKIRRHKLDPDKLPQGVLVGTVEIYDCKRSKSTRSGAKTTWRWLLRNPKRFKKQKRVKGWLNLYPLARRIRII